MIKPFFLKIDNLELGTINNIMRNNIGIAQSLVKVIPRAWYDWPKKHVPKMRLISQNAAQFHNFHVKLLWDSIC